MHHGRFTRVFSAAHRVWNDPGKCSNVHGHNYRAVIDVFAEELTPQNFVIPFDAIKGVVDAFDHSLILDAKDPLIEVFRATGLNVQMVNGVPSTEFMAAVIANGIMEVMDRKDSMVVSVGVRLRETDGIEATAEAQA